ncbi:nucleotide sugar dehydrogenase [Anaerovibrio sp. RM50]|uniref:nucleotide sugar dehydrogenase n=1 Tax=Anaerovibrio sp. RM50 TaxID=1200557 RepID=UPI0005632533|nr:nucleotide sugar dehydrogenase [Anaerovibrio sp. RM50]
MSQEILSNLKPNIAVVGLGYVGMPLAVAFAKKTKVIGFDTNVEKINRYQSGIDPTFEVGDEIIKNTTVEFTSDESTLDEVDFFIVAVPTPINQDKTPDLSPVEGASAVVGRHLHKGAIVVYESTVYPGVTEDICLPILEKVSGLTGGRDFKIGYSPERINPGDKVHRLENIKKIVSGMDEESLNEIAKVYEMIIQVGVHRAPSIKVAEAAKVVENSQRDINIAFMNELATVFERMGIATLDVLEAMNTKWNALNFRPGLVGGHCIGVDPYYFVYQAEKLGYHSPVIMAGRKINDGMGAFVADIAIKHMIKAGLVVRDANVAILGLTFKENCPDIRNTKVMDIVRRLREYGIQPMVCDPLADVQETKKMYSINLVDFNNLCNIDCCIVAVAHQVFCHLNMDDLKKINRPTQKMILIDVKGCNKKMSLEDIIDYWSL